jgi:uncharacterized protein YnzC (UPF0291/DUF896 family)
MSYVSSFVFWRQEAAAMPDIRRNFVKMHKINVLHSVSIITILQKKGNQFQTS